MKLTIQDGRDSFYTFDSNRILLLTATDEEQIKQVEFSTEEAGGTETWTKDVLEQEDGVKYVQVPNEFLNGDYTRLVCYAVALDSKGEFTRQKEVFRIKYRPQPEDWFLTYSERVTFASIKALTEQYKATTKQYMDTTEGFKNNASDSADLARKYAENNEDVAVELGKYSAKHWSIKAEAAKETAVQKATEAGTSEVNSKTYMESAQSAKQDAETAKNAANTILEQVQSKGTEITNFVATSKTEIATAKTEAVNAVQSVYQTDLNELKGDLAYIAKMRDSVNLFNKNDVLVGKDLSVGSGKTYDSLTDNASINVSNIIAVEPNGVYTGNSLFFGNSRRIYQYTSSGYYAGGNDGVDNGDGTYTYSLGSNVSFVRFSYNNETIFDADNYMFVKGSSIPSNYESYGDIIIEGGYVKELDNKIDSNVSDIHGRIDNLEAKTPIAELCDKIDHSKVTRYGFINGGVDGEVVTDSSYSNLWYSDFTEVIGGEKYYYGGYVAPVYCAFYDKDKNYISGYGNTADNRLPNPFVVPDNACYFRFSCMTSSSSAPYDCWINLVNEAPSYTEDKYYDDSKMFMKAKVNNPCDYDGDSFSIFNKVICIGDSITEGTFNHNESGTMQYLVDGKYSYPTYLKKLSGVETVNKGMGGYTSVQWWNARQSDDFSGYDCAIINLGINDALKSVSSADTTSALNNIINALKSANNNIKIFMATVVPAYSDGTSAFDSVNNTIKSVCEANNCYLIDLSLYSHVKKYTVSEAGHLTAFGYHRLAKDYISAISYIIDNNRNDFKWIQFTGTDYTYN